MSFQKAISDYSKQKITENNRVYLPAAVKNLGFKAGEEVEISVDRENNTVKLELLNQ